MTGVTRQTFELMVELVKADEKKKKKSGRRPKLIIEDQVLMVIQYWREYRTYYHIGLDWGQGYFILKSCLSVSSPKEHKR